MENEISILRWRVGRGIPSGVHVWFDPDVESVRLFRVPTREQQAVGRDLHLGVDRGAEEGYLDKVGSVSVSESEAEDTVIDEQSQRHLFEEEGSLSLSRSGAPGGRDA